MESIRKQFWQKAKHEKLFSDVLPKCVIALYFDLQGFFAQNRDFWIAPDSDLLYIWKRESLVALLYNYLKKGIFETGSSAFCPTHLKQGIFFVFDTSRFWPTPCFKQGIFDSHGLSADGTYCLHPR